MTLHTTGAGPLKEHSVAKNHEMPEIQRPGGPATGVDRTDHFAGTTKPEWRRLESPGPAQASPPRPGSPEPAPGSPAPAPAPETPRQPPANPPRPASPGPAPASSPAPNTPKPQANPPPAHPATPPQQAPAPKEKGKGKRALYAAARAYEISRRDAMTWADAMMEPEVDYFPRYRRGRRDAMVGTEWYGRGY